MENEPILLARRFIRPAVIEHLRRWWESDGLFFHRIRKEDGSIDPKTVRQIFVSYGVSRGLRSGNEKLLAEVLDEQLANWPDTLLARAEMVREIATHVSQTPGLSGETITKGVLFSGVSKVVWFAHPQGWTLYDSFARRGLGSSHDQSGGHDYEKYYRRLDFLNFSDAMELAREVILDSKFPYLWPERIHDKYLMLCGHVVEMDLTVVAVDAHDAVLETWSRFHGPQVVPNLEKLVDDLTNRLCDHPAFQAHTLIGGKQTPKPQSPSISTP